MAPIFTYYCESCKHTQEELFALKNRPDFVSCTQCNRVAMRQISPTQFIVNGANAANRYSGDSNTKWYGVGEED